MNILTGVIAIILIGSAAAGWKKGLVKVLFSLAAAIFTLVIVMALQRPAAAWLRENTGLYGWLEQGITGFVRERVDAAGVSAGSSLTRQIQALGLPEILTEGILIEAAGQGYAGAFLYDFDPVTPHGEEDYTLTIQKTEGNEADYLQFVSYECGDYDAYPFGKCTVAGENKNENLMFQVARVENRSYTSPKRYWSAGLGFMAVFLLMTLSDIGNGLKRKKKGSYYDTKGFHNHDDLQ